jgi:hypothetical protein
LGKREADAVITLPANLQPQEGDSGSAPDSGPGEPLLLMATAQMHDEGRLSDADRSTSSVAAIDRAAQRHGMDPATLKGIAGIESSMNAGSNRGAATQYKGLFQIGREEWAQYGRGGDIYNADDNADAAARMLKDHASWFEGRYGRQPEAGELYMMHQQGRGFYSAGTLTNVAGNPYPGMRGPQTPASFEAGWTARLGREIARYGGPQGQGGPTAEQAASMTHEAPVPETRGQFIGRELSRRIFETGKETVLAPVRAVQTLKDVTERAMAGEDVSTDPEVGGKILQALSTAMGGGRSLAGGAPKGSIGVFGGRMQEHWDSAMEKLASKAEESGVHPNTIWKHTGLFRGAEGKWRNEISDADFKLKSTPPALTGGRLGDLIEHPDLFEKYPNMKEAGYTIRPGTGGKYLGKDAKTGLHQFNFGEKELQTDKGSVVLHEVQHAIQDEEDFAKGGNPAKLIAGPHTSADHAVQWNIHAWQNYARLAGEVEARNVQKRLIEYLKEHPQLTEDFPRWEQYMSNEAMSVSPTHGRTSGPAIPLTKIPGGYDPFEVPKQRSR